MRKMVIVMAVVTMILLTITGCNTKTDISNDAVRNFRRDADKGYCAGYIRCTRFGFYGSSAYETCVWTRDYRKSLGEKTSNISMETINGEEVWYFLSIAE